MVALPVVFEANVTVAPDAVAVTGEEPELKLLARLAATLAAVAVLVVKEPYPANPLIVTLTVPVFM